MVNIADKIYSKLTITLELGIGNYYNIKKTAFVRTFRF